MTATTWQTTLSASSAARRGLCASFGGENIIIMSKCIKYSRDCDIKLNDLTKQFTRCLPAKISQLDSEVNLVYTDIDFRNFYFRPENNFKHIDKIDFLFKVL